MPRLPVSWKLSWKILVGCMLAVLALAALTYRSAGVSAADLLQLPTPTAAPTSTALAEAKVIRTVNVRSGPGTNYLILAVAYPGEHYRITGKSASGQWWRIDYQGQPAWVFADLVQAQNAGNVPAVAVGGALPAATAAPAATKTAAKTPAPASSPTAAPASAPAASAQGPIAAKFDPAKTPLRLQTVLGGLLQPTFVTNAGDGSGRFFVLERAGRIRVFPAGGGEGTVFLDIQDRVGSTGPEQGLLGLAFAPDYRDSGLFYIDYTDKNGDTVIARYRASKDDPNRADRDSQVVSLWIDQPAPNHNGGMLAFGPDNYLWVGMGDGGGANDTYHNGQNPDVPLAKLLRLNVNASTTGKDVPYEKWGMGLRNPWRFSFDSATGDLWIGDVGQDLFEEVDYVPAAQVRQGGPNFGWPIMEGAHCRDNQPCDPSAFWPPLLEYGHAGNGCSLTGGRVYRGQEFPQLQGVYFYADFCSGNVWAWWRSADGVAHNQLVLPNAAAITSFGVDEAGELYIAEFGGTVRKLVVQ